MYTEKHLNSFQMKANRKSVNFHLPSLKNYAEYESVVK